MSLLSFTLGRVIPRYRTVAQWAEAYEQIVASRPICSKTLSNRRVYIRRIVDALGKRSIGAVRPHEIAAMVAALVKVHPHTGKRLLVEVRDMLNEALTHGWIDDNPAMAVKPPRIKIARRRLTLEQWQAIYGYAVRNSPPWVSRMILLALVTGQRRGDLLRMRFSDVWAHGEQEYLHIEQEKTGARLAIPIQLRLDIVGVSVAEAIEACHGYAKDDGAQGYLLRKTTGIPPVGASASWRFEQSREGALPPHDGKGDPPSLHECRSLSERMYRRQGINTMVLLGHTQQRMTDLYNNARGLASDEWKILTL